METAQQMSQSDVLLHLIRRGPGRTQRELARAIFGDKACPPRVNQDCYVMAILRDCFRWKRYQAVLSFSPRSGEKVPSRVSGEADEGPHRVAKSPSPGSTLRVSPPSPRQKGGERETPRDRRPIGHGHDGVIQCEREMVQAAKCNDGLV